MLHVIQRYMTLYTQQQLLTEHFCSRSENFILSLSADFHSRPA